MCGYYPGIELVWAVCEHLSSDLSSSTRAYKASDVFEPRAETGNEHLAYHDSDFSLIFKLIVSISEKILNNTNVVVWRQV